MILTIDTAAEISDLDKSVLKTLLGIPMTLTVVGTTPAAEVEADKPKPRASKPKATTPEPTEKPVEPETVEHSAAGVTLQDAVDLAAKMISDGKTAEVKAALTAAGAKRVSELAETDVPAFVAALSA